MVRWTVVTREAWIVVLGQLQSNLNFGPAVKPLGITVKKEAGKVIETSEDIDVVKPLATKEFWK